jgi:tetratricopeptide (TPR) repeat protein
MSKCAHPDCLNLGTNKCSVCLRELYCSGECQKGDWKLHKSMCKILKKFSFSFQPYQEVIQIICTWIQDKPKLSQQKSRVLKHLISYLEYQFGDRIPGKTYRERGFERIDNREVDFDILIPKYFELIDTYLSGDLLSMIDCDNLRLPYYEKILDLLRPWSAHLDLNSTSQIENLNKNQLNEILLYLSHTEREIGVINMHRSKFHIAENHFQLAIFYAKQYEGIEEEKTELLGNALNFYGELQTSQGKHADAVSLAEEAYDIVAVAYYPVHPKVQEAATALIGCLIHKGELDKAELYAQMTLDSLKDPRNGLDQQSEEASHGYYSLGLVINQQKGDLEKAERLTRESLRIRLEIGDKDHHHVGESMSLLANILQAQGNLGDETKKLFERSLAIEFRNSGPDGINTAISHSALGSYYRMVYKYISIYIYVCLYMYIGIHEYVYNCVHMYIEMHISISHSALGSYYRMVYIHINISL